MNKLSNSVITAAVLGGLALIGSVMNSHTAMVQGAGGPTVTIDPAQLPLPVKVSSSISGTVSATQSGPWNVGVSGTVSATQSGMWNVGITGTPSVKNLDEPGRQPFEIIVSYAASGCQANCVNFQQFLGENFMFASDPPVPANKRWVLQHISGSVPTNSTSTFVGLQSVPALDPINLKFSYPGPFFSLGLVQAFTSQIFTTIEPGDRAHLYVTAISPGINITAITLSGYLIAAN